MDTNNFLIRVSCPWKISLVIKSITDVVQRRRNSEAVASFGGDTLRLLTRRNRSLDVAEITTCGALREPGASDQKPCSQLLSLFNNVCSELLFALELREPVCRASLGKIDTQIVSLGRRQLAKSCNRAHGIAWLAPGNLSVCQFESVIQIVWSQAK